MQEVCLSRVRKAPYLTEAVFVQPSAGGRLALKGNLQLNPLPAESRCTLRRAQSIRMKVLIFVSILFKWGPVEQ